MKKERRVKVFLAENYQEKPPIREMGETVYMTPLQQALDAANSFIQGEVWDLHTIPVPIESGFWFWRKTIGYKVTYFE